MKPLAKRIISTIFAVLLTVSLLTACSKSEARKVTININTMAINDFKTLVAQKQGLFEKYMPEDVTVEYTFITSGSEMRDALVTGQVDFSAMSSLSLVTSLQNGFPLSYVSYLGCGLYQLFARDENIQSMMDLNSSHKIVVSSIGSSTHIAVLMGALVDGKDPSEFDNSMITMTSSDALTALTSGTAGVDAVILPFPVLLTAWQDDNIHLVRDFSDVITEYGLGSLFCTRQDFIEENPDIVSAVDKALNEAVDILSNNPETAIQIMMEVYEDCDHDTAKEIIDFYVDTSWAGIGEYDKLMSVLYEQGILEQPAELFENIPKYEAIE